MKYALVLSFSDIQPVSHALRGDLIALCVLLQFASVDVCAMRGMRRGPFIGDIFMEFSHEIRPLSHAFTIGTRCCRCNFHQLSNLSALLYLRYDKSPAPITIKLISQLRRENFNRLQVFLWGRIKKICGWYCKIARRLSRGIIIYRNVK